MKKALALALAAALSLSLVACSSSNEGSSASGSGALSCWKTCWDIFGTPARESPLPNKVELWYNNGTLKRK